MSDLTEEYSRVFDNHRIEILNDLAKLIDQINEEKGWNANNRTQGDWAALAHTEISEAFESFRNKEEMIWFRDYDGKPEGMAIEYADALIRILHWFHCHDMDVVEAIRLKVNYNITRDFMHGGKRI